MGIGILERLRGDAEVQADEMDYIEVEEHGEHDRDGKFYIKIETISDFADVDRVQEHVRAGNIVWVKIKAMKEKDMLELKRAIDRLRKTCIAINGDIAGVDEDFIVLTPPGVVVHRK